MKKVIRLILLYLRERITLFSIMSKEVKNINLGSGDQVIPGFLSIDFSFKADLSLDLRKGILPFKSSTINIVVCTSAINYFDKNSGQKIINETFRVLKKGGIARFSTQDLEIIAQKYLNKDYNFFFQKTANGQERFQGKTFADKFNSWFYGYDSGIGTCQYVYDFETLKELFKNSGFRKIEKKKFMESEIVQIKSIDNREDQMFYLEATK